MESDCKQYHQLPLKPHRLKIGCALSFNSKLAFAFVHIPNPSEKISGKFDLSSLVKFSALAWTAFTLLQIVFIGRFNKSKDSIQSVPNKFQY